MIKIIKIIYLFFILLSFTATAQVTQPTPNFFKQIKSVVKDSASNFYYSKLLNKLKTDPASVSEQEMYYLYYGQVAWNKPNILSFMDANGPDEFRKVVLKKNNKKIVEFGKSILVDKPMALTTLMHTVIAIKNLKQSDDVLEKRLDMMLKVIFSTGDGKTSDTPIKIVNIDDASIIKGIVNFIGGQDGIEPRKGGVPLNYWEKDGKKIYFEDVSMWVYAE